MRKQYLTSRLRRSWIGQVNFRLGVWGVIIAFAIALLIGCQFIYTPQSPDFYPWEGSWTYTNLDNAATEWSIHRTIVAEKMGADGVMRYQISPTTPKQRNAGDAIADPNLPWYAKRDGWVWQYETETAPGVKIAKYEFALGETWTEPFDIPVDAQHSYQKLTVQSLNTHNGRLIASVTGQQYTPNMGGEVEIQAAYGDGIGMLSSTSGYPNDSEAFWTTVSLLEYRSGKGRVKYRG